MNFRPRQGSEACSTTKISDFVLVKAMSSSGNSQLTIMESGFKVFKTVFNFFRDFKVSRKPAFQFLSRQWVAHSLGMTSSGPELTAITEVSNPFFWNSFEIIILGIIFGIAEKFYDEYSRFVQFKNTNKTLFNIALSKLLSALLAGFLSYVVSVDIKYTFSILLLFASAFINWSTIYFAICCLSKSIQKSFFGTLKLSFKKISEDTYQISSIFIGTQENR